MHSKFNRLTKLSVIIFVLFGLWLIRYLYYTPKLSSGDKAVDFTLNINGESLKFSSLRGNYVLLSFWGSWCPPCRKEAPELVALYHDFHKRRYSDADGFEILSIGIENNEKAWRAAIRKLGLLWPYHHSDLMRFDSPIAQHYGVRSIPTKFLIDPKGNIMAVNPDFEQIKKLLRRTAL